MCFHKADVVGVMSKHGYLNNEALGIISSTHRDHSYFSKGDVCRHLNDIRHMMTNGYSQLNFDNPSFLSNDEYVTLTGFDKDQFHEITESLTSLKNDAVRSIRMSVATFLLKLRTRLSNKRISVLIQEPQIQRIIYNVWPAFMTDFVPGNLGFEHISRKDFCKNHTTQVASSLFSMSRWCKFCFRRYIHLYSNEFRLCFSKTIL